MGPRPTPWPSRRLHPPPRIDTRPRTCSCASFLASPCRVAIAMPDRRSGAPGAGLEGIQVVSKFKKSAKCPLLGRFHRARCRAGGRALTASAIHRVGSNEAVEVREGDSRRLGAVENSLGGIFTSWRPALLRPSDPMSLHPVNQRLAANIEVTGGVRLVPVALLQRLQDEFLFNRFQADALGW